MLSQTMIDPMALAWMGAIFLFFGEVAALMSLPSLVRVVVWSTIAEIGYILIGVGLGGEAGLTGAYMHFGYQVIMRGLVIAEPVPGFHVRQCPAMSGRYWRRAVGRAAYARCRICATPAASLARADSHR